MIFAMRTKALFADMPDDQKVLIDVKALMDKQACVEAGYLYWRL